MGRTSTARERLLDAACTLMRTRSYGTVGVADICTHADVRKGSFYHYFVSKQALTLAAINQHWASEGAQWRAILEDADHPPLDRLHLLCTATAEKMRRDRITDGSVHGCVFANLALELSAQDEEVQRRLREIFEEQIDLIAGLLTAADAAGDIPDAGDDAARRALARSLIAQLEGMVLFAKLRDDPDVLGDLWPHAKLLLRA